LVIEAQADRSGERHASVFICHSRKDKDFVGELKEALEKHSYDVWVDVENILPTEDWLASVYSGIEKADAFVYVISSDSIRSEDCQRELDHAVEHNKRLVPIMHRSVDDKEVPKRLGVPEWIFFRDSDDFDRSLQTLTKALDTDLEWVHEHTRLLTRAIEWDGNRRDDSFVLRGSDLRTAEEWQVRAEDKEPRLTRLQNEYILASRKAERRRQRLIRGGITSALVVAIILSLIAFWQRSEALDQANIALARQLAAQSELIRDERAYLLPRSVLLAVESMKRYPSLEADQALRGGLALLPLHVSTLAHQGPVYEVDFSPDGKYLATAGYDNARVWEAQTGKEVFARMTHKNGVNGVAFSPDGKYLATASNDNTARVWEAQTGKEVARMAHENGVNAVAFSPDGKYLATASGDNTARVWEAQTGKEVARMTLEGAVSDVDFSPDGKYLATASGDTAQVWYGRPEDLIYEACARLSRNLAKNEWQVYLPDEPPRKTCRNLPEPT